MSWTKVGAVLPGVLASIGAACARVTPVDEPLDGGMVAPSVTAIEPQPGVIEPSAKFAVHFSAQMDEGPLLASTGRSETVVLVPEAAVERAAAAIEHSSLSAHERELLVPAAAEIASDLHS